jgi:hypothetical protein
VLLKSLPRALFRNLELRTVRYKKLPGILLELSPFGESMMLIRHIVRASTL